MKVGAFAVGRRMDLGKEMTCKGETVDPGLWIGGDECGELLGCCL